MECSRSSCTTPTAGPNTCRIGYTESLGEAGAVTSVASRGDSYDNALAETIIGLCKTESMRRRGPWKGIDDVEFGTLEWVDWFNHRRLLEPIGDVPPADSKPSIDGRRTLATLLDPTNPTSDEVGASTPTPPPDRAQALLGGRPRG